MSIFNLVVRAFPLVLVIASGLPLFGALRWEQTVVERVAPVAVDTVEVVFGFSNPEKYPISIVSVQPSCGCTTATLIKTTFAPGEKGSVTAVFDGKDLVGLQEKTIQVTSDDGPTPTTLILRITIPPWLELSPRLLWWSVGEEAIAKETVVSISPAANARIVSVKTENESVRASFRSTDDPKRYRVIVQPGTTTAALFTMATIKLETPGAAPRSFSLFVQVR
jgi:Protein of unknown function (DUF1573)